MKLLMVMKDRPEQSSVIMRPDPDVKKTIQLRNYFNISLKEQMEKGICLMVNDDYAGMD